MQQMQMQQMMQPPQGVPQGEQMPMPPDDMNPQQMEQSIEPIPS
jgi:hypothetical protein